MKLKKLFFVLLALALVLILGVCAAAEGDDEPEVVLSGTLELGNAQYTFYSDGNLVLEGSGPVYGTFMDEPMEPYFNDIKTLTVGEEITSLNGLVFTNCKNLETVKLPKSFHITEDNFMNCSHLKRFIVDPDNPNHAADAAGALYNKAMTVLYKYVTGSSSTAYNVANGTEVIWEYAFSNCAPLEKVVLPDSVTTIQDEAFIHCLALREINLPNSLTSLGGNAFFNCRSLQQITLPDQLTRIRAYTFMQCVEMTSVSIPASLREIDGGAFQSCEALTDVYIMMDENTWNNEVTVGGQNDYLLAATPHFLAPSILESGNCGADGSDVQYQLYSDGLLEITGTGKVKSSAFEERTDILQVTIGKNVTGAGLYAFNHCLNLESVTLPGTFRMTIGDSFYYCPALKRFVVDEDSPYLTADAHGCLYSKDMTGLIKFPAGTDATAYVIPDTVTVIHCSAFNYCAALQSITVPDSVTTIETQAFDHCTALAQVNIPAGVTSFGDAVFDGCQSMKQLLLPDSLTEIPTNTFSGCGLESVVIPENVTKIGDRAFWGCVSLSAIELHDGITEIGWGAFGECRALQNVVLPKYITEIKPQTFMNDMALEEITIPYGVRTVGRQAFGEVGMFGCEALSKVHVMMSEETWNQNVTVAEKNDCLLNAPLEFLSDESDLVLRSGPCGYGGSDLDVYTLFTDGTLIISGTSLMDDWTHASRTPWADLRDSIVRVIVQPGVTSFGPYAFMYTPELESVVLPEGISYIGAWAFCGCEKLTSINIPSTIRNIYGHAFQGCKGLKTIDMQSSKITTINYCTFNGCSKLETVTLPPTLQGFSESSFSDCFALREINIPDGVVTIGVRAFGSCRSLENLVLPDSVTTIKNGAFQGCSKVNPPKLPANLQTLEDLAFAACNFESVLIPAQLTVIPGRAFAGNPNLTSVEIPAYVEGLASSAFAECKALTAYTVAPENQNYKSIDGVLFTKDGTKLIDYPAAKPGSFYIVPNGVTELADYAFSGCSQLNGLILPEGLTTIGTETLSGCSGLTSLYLPQGVTTVGGAAFRGCSALEQIDLSDTLKTIGSYAFDYCTSLRSVTLPASLTEIGHYAFGYCQGLEEVILIPGLTDIPEGVFNHCDALREIHYVGTVSQWLATTVNQYTNEPFRNAAVHIHDDFATTQLTGSERWESIPTSDAGLKKGACYLDFTDAVKEAFPAEQQSDALAMLNAGSWSLDYDSMTLKGALTLPAALYPSGADKQIIWHPSRDVLASALREAETKWVTLRYGEDGCSDGDWYLDLDAFVDAVGRGKTEQEKDEVRDLIRQHVTFKYNPDGRYFVYRFEYTALPVEGGKPITGYTDLPIGLALEDENAFPYDYNALKDCVVQYRAPDAPDPEPDPEPEQKQEEESWFQKHIIGPMKSAVSSILSFFRKLFKKNKR